MDESTCRPCIHGRVIVHADLDCFYCQVEHVRLGIPTPTPLAVQQWDGLIAINYAARKFGVKRGDRTEAARRKCPQITLVHVETIDTDDAQVGGDGSAVVPNASTPSGCTGGGVGAVGGTASDGTARSNSPSSGSTTIGAPRTLGSCKVSLERYRVASFSIMAIFQKFCRRVERASIDEAYLDMTEEAAQLCQDIEAGKAEGFANTAETDLQGTAGHRVDPTNAFDRALLAGARLVAAMRLAVEQELGFTVSAGIASNKMLAKLASSRNKPNKQTVVPAGAASEMLHTVPLQTVRGLGGKLGEAVVSWSKADTASDLKNFGRGELVERFGPKTGEWLWRICRGMDDEVVTPNFKPKSLSVCKSFAPVRDREAVVQWMELLCKELAHRISVDRVTWGRRAVKLTLQLSSRRSDSTTTGRLTKDGWRAPSNIRSRTTDVPGGAESPTAESLVSEAMSVFDKIENSLPCTRLVLTAHEFSCLVSGKGSIASFLRATPSSPSPTASPGSEPFRAQASSSMKPGADLKDITGKRENALLSSRKERGTMGSYFSSWAYDVASVEREGKGNDTPRATRGLLANERTATSVVDAAEFLELPGGAGDDREGEETIAPPAIQPIHGDGKKQVCEKCGVCVADGGMSEHLDFHYAEGLQEIYAREGDDARDMQDRASESSSRSDGKRKRGVGETSSSSTSTSTRSRGRRTTNPSDGRSTTRIDSFFRRA